MPRVEELKGETIVIWLLHGPVEQKHPVVVTKLVEVEQSGVWIEGKDLAEHLHAEFKLSIVPKMPIFFVPFAQIAWISSSADYPSISEKALAL